MSSLACILNDLGYQVIGYDDYKDHKYTEDALKERNIPIYYDNSYSLSDEVIVYSAAFKDTHPELIRAKEKCLKTLKYNQMLGELTRLFKTIAVSGCHGKTTTSSMLAHVLNDIIGVNYLIGDGSGHASKENEYFVIEACEYRRHFLEYDPLYSVITNIEYDHVDYYHDIDDMISAYQSFIEKTKNGLIVCGDDQNVRKLKINKDVIYYGLSSNNDLLAKNIRREDNHNIFDVYYKNEYYGTVKSLLFGNHMILNTLAVIGICIKLNLSKEKVLNSLHTFKGAKKRFDETVYGDVIVVDDYGHHPTEVEVTIKTAREKYPDKTVVAVYMPDTYSRLKMFYKEYARILSLADYAYVTPVGHGREKQEEYPGVTSKLILDNLKSAKLIELDDPYPLLKYHNAVILFMSCGNIYVLKENFEKLLRGNHE